MKKRVFPLLLALVMVLSVSIFAVEARAGARPTLSISGTTATCSISIMEVGSDIDVTLELWCGNTLIDSWSDNGSDYVKIRETCKVTKGKTYTLIASGTINGKPFESDPVTKTCK